jgi:hypothetical protein
MSLNSPAEIIPFRRFLECRDRLHRIAVAKDPVVIPASTDLGIQPDVTGSAIADHAESPGLIGQSARRRMRRRL